MFGSEWRLTRGGETLAFLRCDRQRLFSGYPCAETLCETTPAFEPLRHFFEREMQILDNWDGDQPEALGPEDHEWTDIWDELQAPGLFVESADGRCKIEVPWFHMRDGRGWFWPLYKSPKTVMPEELRIYAELILF